MTSTTPPAPVAGGAPDPRAALWLSSGGHALCHGTKIALPAITLTAVASEFGVGVADVGLAMGAYTFAMAAASVPAGLLGDRLGPARVLAAFFWLMAAASLGCAWAPTFGALLVAHTLLGLAAGLFHPAGLSLVAMSVPSQELGRAMGLFGVYGGVGWFLAPLAVGSGLGWRAGFVAVAGAAVVGAIATHVLVRRGLVRAGPVPDDGERAADGGRRSKKRHGGPLLVAALLLAMGCNAFLLDGWLAMYPEAVQSLGTWIVEERTLMAIVMGVGAIGQYVGGILARDHFAASRYAVLLLLQPLTLLSLAQSLDEPAWPFMLMGSFAFMNFMTQPIENKLLAVYSPARRRATAFALKFVVALLVASPAPWLMAGLYSRERWEFDGLFRLLALLGMAGVFAGWVVLRQTRVAVRKPSS